MQLYFAWHHPDEAFCPTQHAREDEDVFDFLLTHEEGKHAKSFVHIRNPLGSAIYPPQGRTHAFISTRRADGTVYLLFSGRLSETPAHLDGELVKIEFTAEPINAQERLETLKEQSTVAPFWDPLFITQAEQDQPSQIYKARCSNLYWDRQTGEVSLSDIFGAESNTWNIQDNFFKDSLIIETVHPPVSSLEVTLEAQWVQRVYGHTNLSSQMASAFPEKIINTFTDAGFSKSWPRKGRRLGRSGYWVCSSQLESILPPKTGQLNTYPLYSSPLWARRSQKEEPEKLYAKRTWYNGRLILGWEYRQKRVETLQFTLTHDLQPFFQKGKATSEKIHLTLEPISPPIPVSGWDPHVFYEPDHRIQYQDKIYRCVTPHCSGESFEEDPSYWIFEKNIPTALGDPSRSSFFLTDRGIQAFEHGLETARAHLARKARSVQITFSGSWETLFHLTLDHRICLEDPRLPSGSAIGKVTKIKLVADGNTGQRIAHVTLGASVGSEKMTQKSPKEPGNDDLFCDTTYVEAIYSTAPDTYATTATGLVYKKYGEQIPQDKGALIGRLYNHPMTTRIAVENTAQEQEEFLLNSQYPHGTIHKKSLSHKQTRLHLKLMKLRGREELTHNIQVDIPQPWASPCHIRFPQ